MNLKSNMKIKSTRGYIDNDMRFVVGIISFVCFLLALLSVAIVGFPGGINSNYSEGARVGVVNKLSNKGVFFKSNEAEASMTGLRASSDSDGNSTISANLFSFSVDPSAVTAVTKAMESGKPVKLIYREWLVKPLSIEYGHVVYAVEDVK